MQDRASAAILDCSYELEQIKLDGHLSNRQTAI
jgi:hypothetical protein